MQARSHAGSGDAGWWDEGQQTQMDGISDEEYEELAIVVGGIPAGFVKHKSPMSNYPGANSVEYPGQMAPRRFVAFHVRQVHFRLVAVLPRQGPAGRSQALRLCGAFSLPHRLRMAAYQNHLQTENCESHKPDRVDLAQHFPIGVY